MPGRISSSISDCFVPKPTGAGRRGTSRFLPLRRGDQPASLRTFIVTSKLSSSGVSLRSSITSGLMGLCWYWDVCAKPQPMPPAAVAFVGRGDSIMGQAVANARSASVPGWTSALVRRLWPPIARALAAPSNEGPNGSGKRRSESADERRCGSELTVRCECRACDRDGEDGSTALQRLVGPRRLAHVRRRNGAQCSGQGSGKDHPDADASHEEGQKQLRVSCSTRCVVLARGRAIARPAVRVP
jgi:hypothetical protein